MRISIIPDDKKIIVDGKTIDLEDNAPWDFNDKHIHAIQWKDGYGSLEYEDIPGEKPVPNKIFREDEFNDIVKPYLDYYNTFLKIYEQKELAAAIAEEENLANQIEELNLDKLEKEAQLVIIEDLQKQNKELRDDREKLYDEQNRLLQKEVYDQQTSKMEIERQKLDHEKQLLVLEKQKSEEYFRNRELELQKNYDKILEEFETQKEAFIEERKQYQELLQKERDKIEKEIENSEKQLAEEDARRENQRKIDERLYIEQLEEIDLRKMELENQKQVFEIQWETNQRVIEDQMSSRKQDSEMIESKVKELDEMKYEILLKNMDLEEKHNDFITLEDLEKQSEIEQLQIQVDKLIDAQSSLTKQNILNEIYEDPLQDYNETGKNYSVDDIISLMDEVNPEKLYTTLTSENINDNDFPVDKVVQWFSALKDFMNKNS